MASCFILVHYALIDHAVDDRCGGYIACNGCFLVTFLNCFKDVLDVCAHLGAEAHVLKAPFLGLLCTFFC